jgi:hypothetical protein
MLISFLRVNRDIFTWKPPDMPGVPRRLIEHSLNGDPKATPKRQHLRHFADDRRDAIKKELAKLLTAGFIREVFHPKGLANPVLVRKKNTNEWRMCVDYTDLNKHCPMDPFGFPRIDQVIDSTAGCDLLSILDYYFGYHQITIKEEVKETTAFITPFSTYCYTTMSFGLKNTGATYQRAIQACFKKQLDKNVEERSISLSVDGLMRGKSLDITERIESMHYNSHEGESRVPYKLTITFLWGSLLQT